MLDLCRCLYERTQVEHRVSSPYHPQTNGLDERTLVHTLTKLTTSHDEWDQCIDAALYAYCIGIQDSSRFSPFFLLYNRHPRKAIDYELKTAMDSEGTATEHSSSHTDTFEETMQKLLDVREQYHQRAHCNIRVAQKRQKMYYDAKHDSNHVSIRARPGMYIYEPLFVESQR